MKWEEKIFFFQVVMLLNHMCGRIRTTFPTYYMPHQSRR